MNEGINIAISKNPRGKSGMKMNEGINIAISIFK